MTAIVTLIFLVITTTSELTHVNGSYMGAAMETPTDLSEYIRFLFSKPIFAL